MAFLWVAVALFLAVEHADLGAVAVLISVTVGVLGVAVMCLLN